jgi:hypothetical protein
MSKADKTIALFLFFIFYFFLINAGEGKKGIRLHCWKPREKKTEKGKRGWII